MRQNKDADQRHTLGNGSHPLYHSTFWYWAALAALVSQCPCSLSEPLRLPSITNPRANGWHTLNSTRPRLTAPVGSHLRPRKSESQSKAGTETEQLHLTPGGSHETRAARPGLRQGQSRRMDRPPHGRAWESPESSRSAPMPHVLPSLRLPVTASDVRTGHRWATYVYDLPPKFHTDLLERFPWRSASGRTCVDRPCNASDMSSVNRRIGQFPDFMADVPVLMKLLLALDIVADPKKADLFLVPALPVVKMFCAGCRSGGACVLPWVEELMSRLVHLRTSAKPHLFLASQEASQTPFLVRQPHVVTLGPGRLVVPSLNAEAALQPGRFVNTPMEHRDIFVLIAFGVRNSERRAAVHMAKKYPGPRKVVIVGAGSIMSGVMDNLTALMHRTVFMPCPMGDLPFTKRFYDAILHGAIPVVFQRPFADPGFRGQRGMAWWYRKGEVDNMRKQGLEPPTEPFIVPDIGVPLDEYVVRLPRHSLGGRPQTQGFIHQLSRIPEAVIRRKLRRVAEVRNLFLYDYKGSGPDAVSVLLRSIYKRVVLGRKSARRKQD